MSIFNATVISAASVLMYAGLMWLLPPPKPSAGTTTVPNGDTLVHCADRCAPANRWCAGLAREANGTYRVVCSGPNDKRVPDPALEVKP